MATDIQRKGGKEVNLQLVATIALIVLYPVGFWVAKTGGRPLIGMPVLVLFVASSIYLLVTSWLLFLMIIGGGILILFGIAGFSTFWEARKGHFMLFIDFIAVAGGIYLLILGIIRCLA